MKRYKALALRTVDMGFIDPHLTNEWGTYDVVLASDVADLERRHSEAVELLRDLWIVLDERAKTDVPSGVYLHLRAFLAEEDA